MKPSSVKEQLARVFTTYPSYRAYLESLDDGNGTLDSWVTILSSCDTDDVRAVVDEIVNGTREPTGQYQQKDQLPFNIRAEAVDRRSRRNAKTDQQNRYHQPRERSLGKYGRRETSRLAVTLGWMVRERKLTRDQNDVMMDELLQWDKGGDEPHWLDDVRGYVGRSSMWADVSKWNLGGDAA